MTGDLIEKEMDLYPIFVNSLINIHTEFEGNEQDGLDDITKRENVGHTEVATDEGGAYINVVGENIDGSFPDGYRFKGWYQKIDETNEVCVSRDKKFYVSGLTEQVTYVARFEYEVTYNVKAFNPANKNSPLESQKYTSVWHDYQEGFHAIDGPSFNKENIIHWIKISVKM